MKSNFKCAHCETEMAHITEMTKTGDGPEEGSFFVCGLCGGVSRAFRFDSMGSMDLEAVALTVMVEAKYGRAPTIDELTESSYGICLIRGMTRLGVFLYREKEKTGKLPVLRVARRREPIGCYLEKCIEAVSRDEFTREALRAMCKDIEGEFTFLMMEGALDQMPEHLATIVREGEFDFEAVQGAKWARVPRNPAKRGQG